MESSPDKLGKDFWAPLIGGIVMFGLTVLAMQMLWDVKAVMGAALTMAFLGAALSRFRKVRLVRRLRSHPELERIYRTRAK